MMLGGPRKGTDEEVDSFDDQLDTPDEVEDSSDEEVESTDEEEDTSDEDYELELKKKSNSKGSKAKQSQIGLNSKSFHTRRYGKTQIGRERALFISLTMKNLVMLTRKGVMENQSDVQNHLVEIQADDHDLLVNSDNENDDMLGYESEKYLDVEDAAKTNHSDQKLVKRDITRLYKFRMEYGKPGDLVREHISLKILSQKKVDEESIDKVWDEITRYFDVDLTVRKLEKSARGKMARSKNVYHHKMGRDEEPPRGIMWLKGRVNKDREFLNDEIRSVGDKLKEANDKIKEGTLNLDDGTDAMTVVFGKEIGGYARGVGSGVTCKRYFDLPRSRQVTPMAINNIDSSAYEVDETQSSVVVRDKDARIQKKSNGLVTLEKVMETMEPIKTVRPKKTPKSRRNRYPDSQSQGNVSPTAFKCKLWHLKNQILLLSVPYTSLMENK
uniref:Uncharacterized protein n=1 Tax=Tanacetum cinerariifolium TaxID=118510 RepID=A0A6L2JNE9_TANCI|nr:hypothetical protein [Tanacetum cinerariifolium]